MIENIAAVALFITYLWIIQILIHITRKRDVK